MDLVAAVVDLVTALPPAAAAVPMCFFEGRPRALPPPPTPLAFFPLKLESKSCADTLLCSPRFPPLFPFPRPDIAGETRATVCCAVATMLQLSKNRVATQTLHQHPIANIHSDFFKSRVDFSDKFSEAQQLATRFLAVF
jgi:hypothetical protein